MLVQLRGKLPGVPVQASEHKSLSSNYYQQAVK